MKRWIIILIVAGAMLFALPAAAKKPPKPPPEPPPVVNCVFNAADVLVYPDGAVVEFGGDMTQYACRLFAYPTDAFTFVFEPYPEDPATVMLHPAVAIRDVYSLVDPLHPIGVDLCWWDGEVGRKTLTGGVFATYTTDGSLDGYGLPDGNCGESEDIDGGDTYTLTVLTGNAKGGFVQLTMTPPPMQG